MTKPIITCVCIFFATNCNAEVNSFDSLRIAHAGGGINGETYTNSYEALDLNIKKGFLYFEIDFSFTKDDKLVCIHDWNRSFEKAFGFNATEKPTLETFEFLSKNKSKYRFCTLDGLAEWMNKNPEAIIITDIKEDNIRGLSEIKNVLPDADRRVIPQIYRPANYSVARNMGFESIIWTLYRYKGSIKSIINQVDKFDGSFAITMPEQLAESNLPIYLAKKNIPTYVHTINNNDKLARYKILFNVTEIYTDFLSPASDP